MFRFFEGLVDPYQPYVHSDTPPRKLWPFLAEYIRPFRKVFAATAVLSVIAAAIDVALIWYVGRLVDQLTQGTPAQVWAAHGFEIVAVALAVLLLRPLLLVSNVALLHNTILPNFGTMIRYRAHDHVLRQPNSFFSIGHRLHFPVRHSSTGIIFRIGFCTFLRKSLPCFQQKNFKISSAGFCSWSRLWYAYQRSIKSR